MNDIFKLIRQRFGLGDGEVLEFGSAIVDGVNGTIVDILSRRSVRRYTDANCRRSARYPVSLCSVGAYQVEFAAVFDYCGQ